MFPAFIFANKIGDLVNNMFGVKTFILFPSLISYSSPSTGDIGGTSVYSCLSVDSSLSVNTSLFSDPIP